MTKTIIAKALHADGICYRWWEARLVFEDQRGIVTETSAGNIVHDIKGDWPSRNNIRTFYWFDRPYNLLEVYELDGTLAELYIHIASPARMEGDDLQYTDHELDVVMYPGNQPFIADEDDFQAAIIAYSYSDTFQRDCRQHCDQALALITRWHVGVTPDQGLEQ